MKIIIHDPLPAVTHQEGTEQGVDRLLRESQRVIAESLNEPVMQ